MFLGIDLGTTNVKAIVVDESGDVVGRGSAPVKRFQTDGDGVEQDIKQIWQATCHAIRVATDNLDASAVLALGVSSQGGSLQILDQDEQPLGRVISWMDGRGQSYDEQFTKKLGRDFFLKHVGHGKSGLALGQVLRLRQEAPEMVARTAKIAFVGDVIVGRLCGRRAHDASSLAIALLYNPWIGKADPELLDHLGIIEEQLPDLLHASTPAGLLTPEAATATGLPPGIPVSPAVHDQYAAALGSGSTEVGSLMLATGTAWVLLANSGSLIKPVADGAFVSKHVVKGIYGQLLSIGTGGSAIEWAMKLFGLGEPNRENVDSILSAAPAGSEGLRFWPMFSPYTTRSTGNDAMATGIKMSHSSNHFVRSLVEGLACELARFIGIFNHAGIPVEQLNLCGEAAVSDVTSQIIANVVGKPIRRICEPAVSALGAAILARAFTPHRRNDLSSLSRQFVPAIATVCPDKDIPTYEALLKEYLELFAEPNHCHLEK